MLSVLRQSTTRYRYPVSAKNRLITRYPVLGKILTPVHPYYAGMSFPCINQLQSILYAIYSSSNLWLTKIWAYIQFEVTGSALNLINPCETEFSLCYTELHISVNQ